MARINIEDSLFKDKRWIRLIIKTGCEHKALGILCGAWILSQTHWLRYRSIPEKAWPKDFDVLIEVELATRRSDGTVYVKGSQKAFKWLDQRSESGQKSSEKKLESLKKARAARWEINVAKSNISDAVCSDLTVSEPFRSEKNDILHKNAKSNRSEETLNGSERNLNGSEPLTPTPTPTPTLSLSHTHTLSQEKNTSSELSKNSEQPYREQAPRRASLAVSRGCIQEFALDKTCVERLSNVTHRAQKAWLVAYPSPEWICFEVRKAHAWCETNPKKAPKDFGRFMNNWLNRAFEDYRKGLQSKHRTTAQKNSDALQEMRDRIDRGEL